MKAIARIYPYRVGLVITGWVPQSQLCLTCLLFYKPVSLFTAQQLWIVHSTNTKCLGRYEQTGLRKKKLSILCNKHYNKLAEKQQNANVGENGAWSPHLG